MKINLDTLKALELKLAEYRETNGSIAEHESANANCSSGCSGLCTEGCKATCKYCCRSACRGPQR